MKLKFEYVRSTGLAFLLAALSLPLSAQTADQLRTAQLAQPDAVVRAREAQQANADLQAAPIHSPADLAQFTATHVTDSPLLALSPLDRRIFEDSLTYNDTGVTSFRYDVLEKLTPTQAYQILSLIGQQSFTSQLGIKPTSATDKKIMTFKPALEPLKGYYCEGKGTCRENPSNACSGGC